MFLFDSMNYKQIQGITMGTKEMAPTYATLGVGYLEKKLYEKYEEKYGNFYKEEMIKLFKRLLDDCFLLWRKSEELQDFY